MMTVYNSHHIPEVLRLRASKRALSIQCLREKGHQHVRPDSILSLVKMKETMR